MTNKNREGIIYKYTNKINGKVYIGQTISEKTRYYTHRNNKGETYFDRAIKKYGFHNFEYKVLFRLSCSNLDDLLICLNIKEKIAIKYFKSTDSNFGYNLTSGGTSGWRLSETKRKELSIKSKGENNPHYGKHHSEETKKRLSIAHTGKIIPEGVREKISNTLKGKKFSIEHNKKISESLKGRLFSESHKKKISESKKGIPTHGRAVVQFSLDGILIKEFVSESEAERNTGVNKDNIRSCCTRASNGRNVSAGGYIWKYKSDWTEGNNISPVKKKIRFRITKYSLTEEILGVYNSLNEAVNSIGMKINTGLYEKYKKARKNNLSWDGKVKYKNFIWKFEIS